MKNKGRLPLDISTEAKEGIISERYTDIVSNGDHVPSTGDIWSAWENSTVKNAKEQREDKVRGDIKWKVRFSLQEVTLYSYSASKMCYCLCERNNNSEPVVQRAEPRTLVKSAVCLPPWFGPGKILSRESPINST